jgi:probable rRNA maturation factor
MPSIKFFAEDIDFKLPHPRKTSSWIKSTIQKEKKTLAGLNYIFCSDEYLLGINVEYLRHKTYTDIITFDMSDGSGLIEGDIFISIQRVKENSEKLGVPFDEELHRVIIHGALHLIGYSDKTPAQKTTMRRKEDAYLSLRK